jgi:GNAT superfamily N-acetyltransferase
VGPYADAADANAHPLRSYFLPPTLTIKRLSPAGSADFLGFFDRDAFPDNPKWAGCYCRFPHVDHGREAWDEADAAGNRADVARRIDQGRMSGYMAYADGKVVGWVNAAPCAFYPPANVGGPDPDDAHMGHILCFVVAPAWRGQGVARALLDAVCADLKAMGLRLVQANPRLSADGAAANHHGPLALYESAGFTRHRLDESDGSVFVRRVL